MSIKDYIKAQTINLFGKPKGVETHPQFLLRNTLQYGIILALNLAAMAAMLLFFGLLMPLFE